MNKIHIYYLHYLFKNFETFKMNKKKLLLKYKNLKL